ncbi:hypothetical protein J7L67_01005 [bacterium]|nr:hypothetical protein [bacterium]
MTDSYDKYDERTPSKKFNILSFFGFRKKDDFEDEGIVFECAGASWLGDFGGEVDPNPMCVKCGTQLSFCDKDLLMCEHCHKLQTKIGEFRLRVGSKTLTYNDAYIEAQKIWAEKIKEYE